MQLQTGDLVLSFEVFTGHHQTGDNDWATNKFLMFWWLSIIDIDKLRFHLYCLESIILKRLFGRTISNSLRRIDRRLARGSLLAFLFADKLLPTLWFLQLNVGTFQSSVSLFECTPNWRLARLHTRAVRKPCNALTESFRFEILLDSLQFLGLSDSAGFFVLDCLLLDMLSRHHLIYQIVILVVEPLLGRVSS